MTPQLSVIIPVYKVEAYLERCVNSVLNQDFRDLEVILVDDGSPDRCPQICDEIAQKDNRVLVIHKPNGGVSSARNAGIKMARGEYIAFLDSDDQWGQNKLLRLMEQVLTEKPEMTLFLSYDLLRDGSIVRRKTKELFSNELRNLTKCEYYSELISSGDLHESGCTKILRLDFIKNNSLFFKEGITGEDTEWMFRILRVIDKISISNVPLFIYTYGRESSISNSISVRNINDLIGIINNSIEFYKINPYLETKGFELAQCSYLWSTCLAFAAELTRKEASEIVVKLKQIVKNLDLNTHPKSKKVANIYYLLGFNVTSKVLQIYLSLHQRNLLNRKIEIN